MTLWYTFLKYLLKYERYTNSCSLYSSLLFTHVEPYLMECNQAQKIKTAFLRSQALLGVFRADTLFFPCFFLPPPPLHRGHPSPSSTVNVDPRDPDTFVLWGLTFGIVEYLSVAAGGRPFAYQKPPYFRSVLVEYPEMLWYENLRCPVLYFNFNFNYVGNPRDSIGLKLLKAACYANYRRNNFMVILQFSR